MRIGVDFLGRFARGVAAALLCMLLAACTSYSGPVTNAAPPAGSEGPPLLTGQYSP